MSYATWYTWGFQFNLRGFEIALSCNQSKGENGSFSVCNGNNQRNAKEKKKKNLPPVPSN
jgi:hypothetical protein